MTLAEKQRELIEDLNHVPDAHERLGALNSYVAGVALPEDLKREELLVPGCVSRVWMDGRVENGRMQFRCAADSPMVAGLVALLCHLYSGAEPNEVVAVEPEVLKACGLTKVLSPTRLNGLNAVRGRIKGMAAQSQA